MDKEYEAVIIGGGAAGMFAAVTAAERGVSTAVIERIEKFGRKLAITGKGRCNVTNNSDIENVMRNLPKNPRFMYSALNALPPAAVMEFFEKRGVPLKTERGNRVFPVSDKAYDIVDALYGEMKRLGVKMINARATGISVKNATVNGVFCGERFIPAKSVILATGGLSYPVTGSTGDGYEFAKSLGHTVTELKPSLVPLETRGGCAQMMGLSLKNVTLTVSETGRKKPVFKELGEMLFTHFGISGPLVLSASSVMGAVAPGKYTAYIDFKPALDVETLDKRITRDFDERKNMILPNALRKLLPEAVIPDILKVSGLDGQKQCNAVTRQERRKLLETVKAFPLEITSYRPIAEAIITDGGISVREIDPKTMRSKLVSGLYFAGEIIDVIGFTGGFNLQTAFSTAYLAGMNV